MAARGRIFAEIGRKHRKVVPHLVARMAFTPSTLRTFAPGDRVQTRDKITKYVLRRVDPSYLRRLRTQDRFDRWVYDHVAGFPRTVRLRNGRPPRFGHKAKLINLYLKTLTLSNELFDQRTARRLQGLLHVPLDSIILRCVWEDFRRAIGVAGLRKAQLQLPAVTRRVYDQIQAILRAEAKKDGVPAVWYDDHWAIRERERTAGD